MDNSNNAPRLTLDDLIAWGRDYLESLQEQAAEARMGRRRSLQIDKPTQELFLKAAIEAMVRQRDQAPKPRRSGGRPPGGMGEQMARLVDHGMSEADALRITQRAWNDKDAGAVLRAYARARKTAPPKRRTPAKNPRQRSPRPQKTPT